MKDGGQRAGRKRTQPCHLSFPRSAKSHHFAGGACVQVLEREQGWRSGQRMPGTVREVEIRSESVHMLSPEGIDPHIVRNRTNTQRVDGNPAAARRIAHIENNPTRGTPGAPVRNVWVALAVGVGFPVGSFAEEKRIAGTIRDRCEALSTI